jgi:hypothetical protein
MAPRRCQRQNRSGVTIFPGAHKVLPGNGLVGLPGRFWHGGQATSENAAGGVAMKAWKAALEVAVQAFWDETLRVTDAARPGR